MVSPLWRVMVAMPWPFLVVLPILFALLIGFGWTQDDFVETQVANIWVPTEGSFHQDKMYADSYDRNMLSATSAAAMAIARDGGNLLTSTRLEEIRARMEKAEKATVQWKDHSITWEDICAVNNVGIGTVYKFPCTRLSPMDLFQEARWYFTEDYRNTWYNKVVRKLILKPRIPRFGIMQQQCPEECYEIIQLRTNATFAKEKQYPASYVNPLSLFDDIGSMEMQHPCRACIESKFEATMKSLTTLIQGSFLVLYQEMIRYNATLSDPAGQAELGQRAKDYGFLAQTITREDVEEYYSYSVIRDLYSRFGIPSYWVGYANIMRHLGVGCANLSATESLQCPPPPPENPQLAQFVALQALLKHADGEFSNVNTAGSPFPFWSSGDGTGNLFEGEMPVSGSGIDLTGNVTSIAGYLDLANVRSGQPAWNPGYDGGSRGFADPLTPDPAWVRNVESNPFYKWFMASLEPSAKECANGALTGAQTSSAGYNALSATVMAAASRSWCTKYNEGQGSTRQDKAKMWYDLLIDSDQFLGMTRGEDDPYTWTIGSGCGYDLGGERDPYSNQSESTILRKASRDLYYLDEGLSIGPVDRTLLIGGVSPAIGDYNFTHPLETVSVAQTLYFGLLPADIVKRVKNCNRPGGAITDMTEDEAKQILEEFKEAMENAWTEGWDDDNAGEVQFVFFFDDSGSIGTTGRTLLDITLDNGKLLAISIALIALFSVVLLISPDWIESRVLVTLVGVSLVVLAFFAALGTAILADIKINVTIAWTLPFIMLGLGVDDVYIVLMALKKQPGFSRDNFVDAMREVSVPVAMTSTVNCLMFAVLNISDIPAIYKTATVACICVIFLYFSVMFCFPAFCWLDMKRQAAGYRDVVFCVKAKNCEGDGNRKNAHADKVDSRQVWLYDKFYQPLVLGEPMVRVVVHAFLFLGTLVLLAVGLYGITERDVGLGLEDFFPYGSQAQKWASTRSEELAGWSIGINWGALNYTNPDTQLKMIKQFEDVLATPHVSDIDTKFLWMSSFLEWTTKHCTENFDREDPAALECGMNQLYEPEGTHCTGTWVQNIYGLRNKLFPDPRAECEPYEGGLCRPSNQMFVEDLPDGEDLIDEEKSWCPTAPWSDGKFKWCLEQYRYITNFGGGRFVFENATATETECPGEFYKDEKLLWPIPFSAGPTLFAYDLFSHELTLDLLEQTRAVCDDNEELHCWMTGIPFDYWSQYDNIFAVLMELSFVSAAVGFGVALIFMFAEIAVERRHNLCNIFGGSMIGALLITLTVLTCLITNIGLSVLAGVSMTGFSNMAFVLSVGFTVEYSVHITLRWLRAPNDMKSGLERVRYTMSFLMLPTFMSWISSTIGVVCMAFTEFQFTDVFFFRPLIIVMIVTYFVGCYVLPALLTHIEHDIVRLGEREPGERSEESKVVEKEASGKSDEDVGPHDDQPEEQEPKEVNFVVAEEQAEEDLVDEPANKAIGAEAKADK